MIIGAGFAGLSAAGRLSRSGLGLEITLFDKKGQFSFLPLIPDCIGRGINPEFLVNDVASFCRKLKIRFIRQEATFVDLSGGRSGPAQLLMFMITWLLPAAVNQTFFLLLKPKSTAIL